MIVAVLIVPGLELISGYRRARAHTVPARDLYVLAQAIAVSLAWLPVIWVLGGSTVIRWAETGVLTDHQVGVLLIVSLNLVAALLTGLAFGRLFAALAERPNNVITRALTWTGVFEPPSAWDAAWLEADKGKWAAVALEMRSGEDLFVLYDEGSTVGLSPAPRDLFFDTEYVVEGDDVEAQENHGIYVDGREVVSFRVVHIEPKDDASS